jgi:hypothetical protein
MCLAPKALARAPHPVLFHFIGFIFIVILVFSHFLDYFILCSLFCFVRGFSTPGYNEEGGMSAGTASLPGLSPFFPSRSFFPPDRRGSRGSLVSSAFSPINHCSRSFI